jgi:hypothetical protein
MLLGSETANDAEWCEEILWPDGMLRPRFISA